MTEQLLITPQSRRAHRDFTTEASGLLRLDDPCGPWASLVRQPSDHAASSLTRVHGCGQKGVIAEG